MAEDVSPLMKHALDNIRNKTYVTNPDGSKSTIRSGSVNYPWLNDGKPTLIPFVWGGKVINNPDIASEMALESGIKWPVFKTHEDATKASKELSDAIRTLAKEQGLEF